MTSLGRQDWSIQAFSGLYIRRMVNQLVPGIVCIQLLSYSGGGLGVK